MRDFEFQAPKSIIEATRKFEELALDIQTIQTHLGRPKPDNKSLEEFNTWRLRAKFALLRKAKERDFLRKWLRTKKEELLAVKYGILNAEDLPGIVAGLIGLITSLDIELSSDQKELLSFAKETIGLNIKV